MRKITIEDFANEIKKSIAAGEITTYYIADVPVRAYEGNRKEERVILDVSGENKYDTIYEELNKSLQNSKKIVSWNCEEGTYSGEMVIDSTVILKFRYCSLEGQAWLYRQSKK